MGMHNHHTQHRPPVIRPGSAGHVPYSPAFHHGQHVRPVGIAMPRQGESFQRQSSVEPTDTGIIPPQFRKAHQVSPQQQSINAASNHQPETNGDKKQPHQWSSSPVQEWAKEQVCQWLLALGMESYISLFMDKTITGAALLNLDSSGLKDLGIKNKDDREKKDMEKEKSRREKLLNQAEKPIGKANQ